ncbi:hypothetical protein ACTS95_08090 [Empedobacter brevis]
MKITAQESIIEQIKQAIETSSIGLGLQEKYNIILSPRSVEFNPKTEQEPNMQDFFWLGWFANQYEN